MTDINSLDKATLLEIMKKKLEAMLSKSKEELHSLEVEWLHLRSLALREERTSVKTESKTNVKATETNFDDINGINSQQFSINKEVEYTIKHKNNICESESEEDL